MVTWIHNQFRKLCAYGCNQLTSQDPNDWLLFDYARKFEDTSTNFTEAPRKQEI